MTRRFTPAKVSFRLIAFFCLICLSFSAAAQNGGIRGRVATSDGAGAAYVDVLLKGTNKGTSTDESGVFQLTGLGAGDYTLVIKYLGLTPQERSVHVVDGHVANVSFSLPQSSQQLAEVKITGQQSINERPVAIGKLDVRPIDLPQSVSFVSQEVLEKQQVQTIGDALQNVNGVYQMGNTGGFQQEIAGRGFSFGSSNTFKNGARYNNSIMPEVSALERIEVLKGSNAILFGNVAAGGVLNLVTKKPKFENGGEVAMRLGSYNFYKPSLDIYGAVNNSQKVAYRINTTYENAESFRDNVSSERFYINPSLLFKLNDKLEVLVEGDYLNDERTPDYGIGAINYTIPDLPRSRFIGIKWSNYKAEQKSASTTIAYTLAENWKLQAMASYQTFASDLFANGRPSSTTITANGDWSRALNRSQTDETYALAQLDLTGKFETGFLGHAILLGADADKYDTDATAFNALNNYDKINIFDLNAFEQRADIPSLTVRQVVNTPVNRVGVYVQDLITVTEKLKVLAGVRYSYLETRTITDAYTYAKGSTVPTITATALKNYDDAFSPRVGVVYQPKPTTSFFASYANSFIPNINRRDINDQPLAPSLVDQYEIGVKNDLLKGLLTANLTAYKIVNSDFVQSVPADQIPADAKNPNSPSELTGEVTSNGVELDVQTRSFKGFSVLAGYSYNDTRYTKSKNNNVNERLRYNPSHTANASVFYTLSGDGLLSGLNTGLTAFYVGDRLAGRNPRTTVANDTYKLIEVPDYFQFDAHVGYTLDKLSVRVKVSNLLNKLTYYAHDDNSINPIAPRMFMTTVTYKL